MKRPFQLQGEASPGEPTGITTEKTALSLPSPVCEFMEFSLKRSVWGRTDWNELCRNLIRASLYHWNRQWQQGDKKHSVTYKVWYDGAISFYPASYNHDKADNLSIVHDLEHTSCARALRSARRAAGVK